jgi:hypothetical protein
MLSRCPSLVGSRANPAPAADKTQIEGRIMKNQTPAISRAFELSDEALSAVAGGEEKGKYPYFDNHFNIDDAVVKPPRPKYVPKALQR